MSMVKMSDLNPRKNSAELGLVQMGIDTIAGFESMQRVAGLYANSDLVPQAYRNKISNCFIALDMALRMGANPLLIMQNLYIVHGNPAWSAQFLIATFNKCGRFSAIRYEFSGQPGKDDWGCRASATELATGEKLQGPLITIGLAKKEGWYQKSGSKWQTMPEQMLRYRAAAWFVRAYAPEIAMGLQTAEEVQDAVIEVAATCEPEAPEQTLETLPKKNGKAKKAAPAENPEKPVEQPPTPQPVPEDYYACIKEMPDGNPKMVSAKDCEGCPDNDGCPNRVEPESDDATLIPMGGASRYPD